MTGDDRRNLAEWCFANADRCAKVGAVRLAAWWRVRAQELAFGDDT